MSPNFKHAKGCEQRGVKWAKLRRDATHCVQALCEAIRPRSPMSCAPGRGGPSCNVTREVVLGGHDPFGGFVCPYRWRRRMTSPKYIQGWSVGYGLYKRMVEDTNATLTIEVGVWKGLSTAFIARSLEERGGGIHFAVDTWLGKRPHLRTRQCPASASTRLILT